MNGNAQKTSPTSQEEVTPSVVEKQDEEPYVSEKKSAKDKQKKPTKSKKKKLQKRIKKRNPVSPEFPLDNFYAPIKPIGFLRKMLSRITLSFSSGYGNTFFHHQLNNVIFYQGSEGNPVIFSNNDPSAKQYGNWITALKTDNVTITNTGFRVNTTTAKLDFTGNTLTIPLTISLHYEFLEKYRLGLGYSHTLLQMGTVSPVQFKDQIRSFKPDPYEGHLSQFFILAGGNFYRWNNIMLVAESNLGWFISSNQLTSQMNGFYINLGIRAEYMFSKYLSLFIRPSYEFKSYPLTLPEGSKILHTNNTLYITTGLSYRLPKLSKCFHRSCQAQINHAHGNRAYRSRAHSIFKKQHPGYGENYRMKRKN